MMPFSILRIFGLAILNWGVLAACFYCGYEAYREFSAPDRVVIPVNTDDIVVPQMETTASDRSAAVVSDNRQPDASSELSPLDAREPATRDGRLGTTEYVVHRSRWYAWSMLAAALLCLGWSVGGSFPTSYLLGNSNGAVPQEIEPTSTNTIVRPDGTKLHTETYGVPGGPTLLLTHGWSLDGSAWDYIKGDLAKKFKIVVWDLAGLGKSEAATSGDQSMQKMAQDLEAVRLAACGNDPVILVGHSIGGMIQQEYCKLAESRLQDQVKGLVFVHTTYINPVRTNLLAGLTIALQPLLVALSYLTIPLAPLAWLSNWQSYYNGSMQLTSRLTSFSGKQTREQLDRGARLAAHAWPAVVARGYIAMVNFEGESVLPRISVPVLVVAGEHDRLTLPSAGDHMSECIARSKLVLVDSGHLGYWEQASQVRSAVDQFAGQVFAAAETSLPSVALE